jgi:hypothetical protein
MKYLLSFGKLNELFKSKSYLDRTSSPYSDKGDITLSRAVEYEKGKHEQGWDLVGFEEVDEDGYPMRDEYLSLKNFQKDYNLDNDKLSVIKSVISASIGQMCDQHWVDEFKFSNNKAYAVIFLGKIGFQFEDEYYSPVLKYHSSGRQGTEFWIAATNDQGNFIAKTIMVAKSNISRNELEHNAIALQNASYYRAWIEENEKRRKDKVSMISKPRTVNDAAFISSFEVVKDTHNKSFFVVYVSGSNYNPIDFARKMCGANIDLELNRTTLLHGHDVSDTKSFYNKKEVKKRLHVRSPRQFDTSTSDIKLKIFYYFNKDSKAWEQYRLDRIVKTTPNVQYKELEVFKGSTKTRLRIFAKDELKIPKYDGNDIYYYQVEVGKVDTKNDRSIALVDKLIENPKLKSNKPEVKMKKAAKESTEKKVRGPYKPRKPEDTDTQEKTPN